MIASDTKKWFGGQHVKLKVLFYIHSSIIVQKQVHVKFQAVLSQVFIQITIGLGLYEMSAEGYQKVLIIFLIRVCHCTGNKKLF